MTLYSTNSTIKVILASLFVFLLATLQVWAQNSEEQEQQTLLRRFKKEQARTDYTHVGIGLHLSAPSYGSMTHIEGRWLGINLVSGPFVGGYAQGLISMDYLVNPYLNDITARSSILNASHVYLGTSFPLRFLTFGKYMSYKNVFRGHPILQTTIGKTTFREGINSKTSTWNFMITPGYRIRIPYGAIELALETRFNFMKDGVYESSIGSVNVNPAITVRLDGLLEKFNPRSVNVSATLSRVTHSSSYTNTYTRDNHDGTRSRITETNTYATVEVSPTTVSLTDIGKYTGLGLRLTTNGIGTNYYSNTGAMIGANFLYRYSKFLLGANAEIGRVGHASITRGGADTDSRKDKRANKSVWDAQGNLNTMNIMGEIGFDLNSLLYGMLGLAVNENKATPFASINIGYAAGISLISSQKFSNTNTANTFLATQTNYTKYNDPRLSKSGFVGAWFLGADFGNTSFRVSWYRYRNAPLANAINLSFAWRFVNFTNRY